MKNQNTRKNKNITPSSLVCSVTAIAGMTALIQTFQAPEPAQALGHALNAAAFLLLAVHLLFRPGRRVLYIAVVLVGVLAAIAYAAGPGPTANKISLLELAIALIAAGVTEWQAKYSEPA